MRVAFPDDPAEPITEAGAYAMMDQVNQFYVENSYDTTAIIAMVTPLLILPQYKDAYGNVLGTDALQTDAREAARLAGLDTADYDLDIVLFNRVPGPAFNGWNGQAYIGAKGLWMQGTTSAGVAAHELGHNYGLYHANFWSATGDSVIGPGSNWEYGNPYDTMGAANAGIYHFNAEFKSELNWLTPAFVQAVTNSGVFRLYAFDAPQIVSGQNYALQIRKDYDRNYWAEFRQKFTSNPWLQNGILLNWDAWDNNVVNMNSAGGTDLLDTTPGTPTGNSSKDDSAVVIGRTFSDSAAGVFITPVGRGSDGSGNWIDVQVNLGMFASNAAPLLQVAADQTSVAINVPVTFSATATDANGDTLAYYWEFGDLTFGSNAPSASKSWSTAGEYVVRCTASDMKGGLASRYIVITVGSPATYRASGRITTGAGDPIEGVRVHNGLSDSSYRSTYTDSDGYYALVNLAAGSYTLSAVKYCYAITSSGWSNPLSFGPSQGNVNWTATAGQVVRAIATDPWAARPNPSADTGTFTLSRTGSLTAPLTIKFNLAGTATYQTDYSLTPSPGSYPPYQITIAAGQSATNLMLTPLSVSQTVDPQTVTLTIIEDSSYVLGTLAEAMITISNTQANAKSTVDVVAQNDFVPELGPQSGFFLFTRDGNLRTNLTVFYSIQGTASNGVDYLPLSGAVTIPAGQTTARVSVTAIDNLVVEGNETVTLTILPDGAYQVGTYPSASLVIIDEDAALVFITATSNFPLEGSGSSGTFTVTRFGSLMPNLLVNYTLSGTAANGVDYNALSGSVLIPAGQATSIIMVSPKQDALPNGNRTVVATITSSSAYNIINPGTATITILDDDIPRITLAVFSPTASESGTSTGAFTFTRTGSTSNPLTVYYNIFGTAINGADYASISNSIVIPAGTNSATLTITALADSIREGNETVVLTLQNSAAYSLNTTTPQTVTIIDNNSGGLPGVGFDLPGSSGLESQGDVNVVVSLSAPSIASATVDYAVTGGTATGGFVDYYLPSGTLTFASGQTNKSFVFFVVQDSLVEPNETIVISLINPVNALLDVRSNFVYTILDDDGSGVIAITAIDPYASETGPHPGKFRISRSGGISTDLTVSFEVTGTASSPSDYVPLGNSLTIPAGQSYADLVVTPIDDNTPEPTETVVVTLISAPGAKISSTNSATVLIADNDNSSALPIASVVASDPIASAVSLDTGTFTITRDRNTNSALTVSFTVGGSATSGTDYNAIGSSAVIPAGTTQAVVVVTPHQNLQLQSNRTVVVTLTIDGTYRVPPAAASATVTILNSTPPAITTQPQNQIVNLGSNATFSLIATGTPPLFYQWFFNATNAIVGRTDSLLVLTNVQDVNAGSYSVMVSNAVGSVISSNAALVVNHLPIPSSPRFERYPDSSLKILSSLLLGTDPDGDSLFLSAVSTNSVRGGAVSTNSIPGWIYYQPPAGLTNDDSFGYTVGDGRGGFSLGTVTVALVTNFAPALNLTWEDVGNGTVRLTGDGIPALEYFVEFAETLEAPAWQRLGTVVPDEFGQFTFVDNQTTNAPTRFYRLFRPAP